MSPISRLVTVFAIWALVGGGFVCAASQDGAPISDEWVFWSPRQEAMPEHSILSKGGREGKGGLVIETGEGEQWIGCWSRTLPVIGGQHYQFEAWRKFRDIPHPRRSVVVRVSWRDEKGAAVFWEEPAKAGYNKGKAPRAEPEYPQDIGDGGDDWGRFSDVLRAPMGARRAVIELYLQWVPNARVEWGEVSLTPISPPAPRMVRMATVHFQPRDGELPEDKPKLFAPLIAEAAAKKADIVVLPETLTFYGTGKTMEECAEPVPGPSTEYFGGLAKQHDLYIVAGLVEREGKVLYNVAALIGPDGKLAGKYRKVSLPRSEITSGITPGHDYPVFQTRFGKVGMMVCYDGFFPEVARELSNRGAEVIAWPVWGCNPLLARARACENHVYLISSTYSDAGADWMISGIFDHYGDVMAKASDWGSIAIAEADLNARTHWNSLGDFRAQLPSHRPLKLGE
ncbi:MAG: carbon-nitrogen hydrolase family protein [Verrucomicrobiaceae bacterium]|nr:carbon-nitrogen hydrolase family protein [Verrucomicrobiaceae bacterium]